jgi:5'-methylthioadenosine phosphorylase
MSEAVQAGQTGPLVVGLLTSRIGVQLLGEAAQESVQTPFGVAEMNRGWLGGVPVLAIERYGAGLTVPSHKINYRANLWALRAAGVSAVISQNAIGSVTQLIRPGDVVVPDDMVDRTSGRARSFFDELDAWARVDMTEAFCPWLRSALLAASEPERLRCLDGGVFACVDGPRFETPHEVRLMRRDGVAIVGTPLVPEIILAREAGMCFASLAPVINYAAGVGPDVKQEDMNNFYYRSGLHEAIERIIARAVQAMPGSQSCRCRLRLDGAYSGEPPAWASSWPQLAGRRGIIPE